jgi:hypothetical protein
MKKEKRKKEYNAENHKFGIFAVKNLTRIYLCFSEIAADNKFWLNHVLKVCSGSRAGKEICSFLFVYDTRGPEFEKICQKL